MDQRLYPISLGFFIKNVQPIIEQNYIWKGRPPEISHYQVFCAIMYMLRTGIPWRDLPRCYGSWHTIYQRFKRGSDKGIWWKIVMILQKGKKLRFNIVIADSTTFKVHRHGGGQKGGSKVREKAKEA